METFIEEFDGPPWVLGDVLGDELPPAKSVFFYCDNNWNPVDKSVATRMKVDLYNKKTNKLIIVTWCTREKNNKCCRHDKNEEIIAMLKKQDRINSKLYPKYY